MSLLLLLAGSSASSISQPLVAQYLSRRRFALTLVSPDRATRWRIGQWTDLKVSKDLHDAGALAITAPLNAAWIEDATADSDFDAVTGWEQYSFDVYIDGELEWSGPIISRAFAPGQTLHADPAVTFVAEPFTQHLLSRRTNATTTKADISYNDNADDIIRTAARNANGFISLTDYPVGETRDDFGPDWTMAVEADASAAPSIVIGEQEGGNAWDFVAHVAEKGDCYIASVESPAATWTIDVDYPYQENDRSSAIYLTPPSGAVVGYSAERSIADLVNIFAVKGDGEGASQVKTFYSDTPSTTLRGVFEGDATLPAASSAQVDAEGDAIIDRYANPLNTLSVEIRDTDEARFVYHASAASGEYGMRDKVSVIIPQAAMTATAVVKGWEISQQGAGPMLTAVRLGDLRPSPIKQAVMYAGFIGRRTGGNRWRNRSG